MGDMKDKVKDLMKKVNNPFSSSSSGKFKGQGRTLGSSSPGPTNSFPSRPSHPLESRSTSKAHAASSPNSKPSPQKASQPKNPESVSMGEKRISNPKQPPSNGFDPFDALITSSERNTNGYSLNVFECPICKAAFGSEEEVSVHIESCADISSASDVAGGDCVDVLQPEVNCISREDVANNELEACVGVYVSGKPSESSVNVVLRLLRNIVKEPENTKFRRIRLSNPKIREAVSEVTGCMDLLQFLGFVVVEEEGELWAVMDTPSKEHISMLGMAISLIEPNEGQGALPPPKVAEHVESKVVDDVSKDEIKTVDRQTRVYFSVSESVASKIDLPESFYKLSVEEVRRESEQRKKKLAESQLLIPKSYKEKQAKAARSRYTKTIIRVQFPDGVVLQGTFSPREPTRALYEFVSSSLKEPCLEFELMHPIPVKRRVIPCFPGAGGKVATLDEEDLVPAALVKFRPIETDSIVFTGLRNDLLELSEPLPNS